MTSALIKPDELKEILNRPDVRVLDCTYGQPFSGLGIEKAVNFDIDLVADLAAPMAHTIPSPEVFEDLVGKMGVANTDTVIVYDATGFAFAAARVWWMFRLYGHDNVRVLDGGLPAWHAAGFPLAPKTTNPQPVFFKAAFRPELFKGKEDLLQNLKNHTFTVVDARDATRFAGSAPEPRAGMAAGHVPGSQNVPFMHLINPDGGFLKDKKDLKSLTAHVDLSKPAACTCGSGVTACVVALALYELGHKDAAIYGGSWSEWGGDAQTPKKTGSEP